jgi:predicted exporter
MAPAVLRTRHKHPHVSRPTARREVAAVRRLYRLNREFATDVAELQRKHRLRENALVAFAVLALAVVGAFMLQISPRCTDAGSAPPTILIGGAIKVAGC